MTEAWDYKGLYWDEVTKNYYTWKELTQLHKERNNEKLEKSS
jgi:hypothetical protein